MKKLLLIALLFTLGTASIKLHAEQNTTATAVKQACRLTVALVAGYLIHEYMVNNREFITDLIFKNLPKDSMIDLQGNQWGRTLSRMLGTKKSKETDLLINTIVLASTFTGGMFAGIMSKLIFW